MDLYIRVAYLIDWIHNRKCQANKMEELTAYDRNLGIGDQVIIGPDETLFPLDMAENLGMFDEIDPLSQISETDPRHWQMEWMDNYMDALEELEDSTTRE